MLPEAREWFAVVTNLEPTSAQGWLERAKLEEECGEMDLCEKIVRMGLIHCPHTDSLLIKCIKHYEKMGKVDSSRVSHLCVLVLQRINVREN